MAWAEMTIPDESDVIITTHTMPISNLKFIECPYATFQIY